jgi:hypothetical protein
MKCTVLSVISLPAGVKVVVASVEYLRGCKKCDFRRWFSVKIRLTSPPSLFGAWSGYNGLSEHGFTRIITVQSSSGYPAHVSMPGVHRIASLLKRWILGTHQGSVVPEHLQAYLEEFTFRFNRRTSRSRGLVFRRLLERAVATGPVTENDGYV